jgi:hypothetical protein
MKLMIPSLTAAAMAASFAAGLAAKQPWRAPPTSLKCAPAAATTAEEARSNPKREAQALALSILRLAESQPQKTAAPSSWRSLWTELTDGSSPEGNREAFEQLVAMAKADPETLDELFRLFENNPDPDGKSLLMSLFSQIGGPGVQGLSMRLATSDDPARRRDGFDLFHRQSTGSPEVRDLLKRALTKETDPIALFHAVSALQPTAMAPGEAKELIGLVRGLTQHTDSMVRRQSIMTLAQWDGSSDFVAPLRQALTDAAPEVRQAAVWAAAEAGNRSEAVKTALLSVAHDPTESPEIRQSALHALERFPLSSDEYASYGQVQSDLAETSPTGGAPSTWR